MNFDTAEAGNQQTGSTPDTPTKSTSNSDVAVHDLEVLQPVKNLTKQEKRRLKECEVIIHRHGRAFIELANALFTIRNERLYRAQYATFADYCQDRLRFSRQYASGIAKAAQVINGLPADLSSFVDNEHCARELGKVVPEKREAVIRRIIAEGKNVTGLSIPDIAIQIEGAYPPGRKKHAAPKKLPPSSAGSDEATEAATRAPIATSDDLIHVKVVIHAVLGRLKSRVESRNEFKSAYKGRNPHKSDSNQLQDAISVLKAGLPENPKNRRLLLAGVQVLAKQYLTGDQRDAVLAVKID
jgi:hypothetical protein